MFPTFQIGDFLYSRSTMQKLAQGDVIVFADSENNGFIVHRIISTSFEGLIARGDHNRLCDSPITLDRIVGKVELVENKSGIKSVSNGFLGLWLARFWHSLFWLDRFFRLIFWVPYRAFRKSGLINYIWRPNIVRMKVKNPNGSQVKFIYKQSTVATWDPTYRRFDCRKPFDLVIPRPEDPKENALLD
jgi:hypothetical protein